MSVYHIRETRIGDARELARISDLRIEVWGSEGSLDPRIRAAGSWLDEIDPVARHWVAETAGGELVATARLSVHERLEDTLDGYVWTEAHRSVPLPVGSISRLVVRRDARRQGLAGRLNDVRIAAARAAGCRSMTVTASKENARLLAAHGFVDTGLTVVFANRPGVVFHALELTIHSTTSSESASST